MVDAAAEGRGGGLAGEASLFAALLVLGVVSVVPFARCARWPRGNGNLVGGGGKCNRAFEGIHQGTKLTLSKGVKTRRSHDFTCANTHCAGLLLFCFWLLSVHHPKTRGRDKIACANKHTPDIAGRAGIYVGQTRAHRGHRGLRKDTCMTKSKK